jgi:predicted ribosome quality control (RQC) complex YloA/Tae2 family protein
MLYIDGISLSRLTSEFENVLLGKKVSKISQYSRFSLSLFFGKNNLFFTVNPNLPVVYLSNSKEEAPHTPMGFSLNLRKHLLNANLYKVEQIGYERVLYFYFERITELGEHKKFKLVFELMGKHSNIFLIDDDGRIIDALKKSSLDENLSRIVIPGAEYTLPPIEKKLNPEDVSKEWFEKEIAEPKDVMKKIEGFGKLSSESIDSYDVFLEFLNQKSSPAVYFERGKIKLGSTFYFPSLQGFNKLEFENINSMINYYIEKTISSEQVNSLKTKLVKTIDREIKKNKKIITQLERDVEKNSNFTRYKELGDILAANLYSIKIGMDNALLFDFYKNEDVLISLDPKLHPKQNLELYYKKYNKTKRGYEFNFHRIEFIEKELEYLDSVRTFLENATDLSILNQIKEELVDGRYMRDAEKSKKSKKQKINIAMESTEDGYHIYFGKNNRENEYVTFKLADKDDMWLHAKDIPGSHVIIKNNGDGFSDKVIKEAAVIAAKNSKLKNESKVLVDYTLKKYVKKPGGAKPGFVIYTHEKGITVKI